MSDANSKNDSLALEHQKMILEEYKLYVEMSDRVATKRAQSNRYYITIISGLLIVTATIIKEKALFSIKDYYIHVIISVLGLAVCFLWYNTITSYKKLNEAKFKVIDELEKKLPYACYNSEWKFMKEIKYKPLTFFEKTVVFTLVLPFIGLLIFSSYRILVSI